MIQARKDGNTNEQPDQPPPAQRPPQAIRAVQPQADPRRAAYVAPTAVILQAEGGGGIPEGTLQYRRVSIAPQLQHVVTPVQVQAASSTTTSESTTPLTVAPRCTITSAQDLANLLAAAATTANNSFHTVELQTSSTAATSTQPQQFQALAGGGGQQRVPVTMSQRLLLNSGTDVFALRLAPSTSQQIMVLDPSSISQPTDVTKVHSYSLASSAMQKLTTLQPVPQKTPLGQPAAQKIVSRVGVKRQMVAAPTPPRTHSVDLLAHLTAVNRLLFGLVPCDAAGGKGSNIPGGSPKAKRIKLEKGVASAAGAAPAVLAKRSRLSLVLQKKLQLLKMKYYQQQTEYFFLKNGGNLVDFIAWRKKMTPALMEYLKANRFEPPDDLKAIQDCLLQSTVQGIRNPLLSQVSASEVSSKSASSHPARLVTSQPSPSKGARPPYKQQHSKHNSISSVYDSQIGSQEEIVERAKQEAYVMQRVGDLRREGLWSLKRLPKVADAPRIKAHHDYLLEEMVWLATDFAQERKWKKAAAKKCARMITRYFQEKEIKAEKAEKEEQMRLRKIASILSREIKQFWNNIEKLAEYRQQTWLEEKRKKVLDTHLNFIVDQTEKYSSWLTQGMNQPHSTPHSPRPSEEDFSPSSSDAEVDDEETLRREEEQVDAEEQSEEIKLLQQESEMPFEDFLDSLPPEMLATPPPARQHAPSKADSEEGKATSEDDEFQVSEEEEDDEQTILEQEEGEKDVNHQEEIKDLEAENEMSIEELREKYSAAFSTPAETPEQRNSEDESKSSEEFSDEELDDSAENSLLKELSSDTTDPSGNPSKEISDIAATAESFQPKGNTLSTTQVCTKVPFLLKHQLREYQHIGLDWLNAMYEKKLNGILADEMGLGKTIQTISVLAHLACEKGVWGPHLIVVPTSVMLNWEMELKKWCPAFKILTYYGTPKERKQKRVGWTKPNAFHVCITSYKLVVQDHQSFRRKRWKYMILDEAQHIKNFKSQRWQMLLNFQSSHRLLLTGTPLQNNLMELWSLMHFLMPNVFQSHREFREWFCNPFTGMIEGSGDYNDSLIKRLHKVLRPFLLRRLKCEVEKQLPKKYEHVVMCRLSNRQRYLYDDFMSQTKTKETLATGNFMSVINILMQLRKVCNHPNMFEERPTVSPFMMEGIRYTTASLAQKALDYDPFKQVSLLSLNLLLADLELSLTAFAAHRVKKFQVPQKLIEEIDSLPEPPPPCPTVKMKVNFCNSQASSSGGATPRASAPRAPAAATPRTAVVGGGGPQPQRFMVFPGQQARNSTPAAAAPVQQAEQQYTLQLVQPGAALSPLGGGLTLQLQPGAPATNRVQCIQSLIGGIGRVVQTAAGAHFVITSVANSVADSAAPTQTPATATTTTSLVLGGNLATVVSQSQRMTNPAVAPPFLSTFNRAPAPPNNRPVGRVAPFNGHPLSATTSEGTVQNHVQTPTKSPLVHSLSKPTPKLEVPTEKKDSLFYLDSLSKQREERRRATLRALARINSLRCSACPIYGRDLVEAVTLVHSLAHPRVGDRWLGKGHVNCTNAVECREEPRRFWQHTSALSRIVRTPEDRLEEMCDIVNRFVFAIPAVTAPALDMHVSHPHPWRLNEERVRSELLSRELTPKSAFLHPITSRMSTQFPELRLIQYDCGKLQRLAHLMWDLKGGQHRVLIFTQMTRMLDILEQFLNYHGHTYLRLDGNTKVEQRQALMERFNADKRIFCFILSTRSGGIGVNLTGADTVIFYDSDWNPTMDAQAQDRCHRIGQTRDVHIYRLISERTIEENILKKANQKRILGDLAIEGGNFTTAFFKKNTIHDLFGIDMQGGLKKLMAEEKRLEEERLQEEKEKFSQKELEQALGMAEEESDLQAAQTASAEAVAELAEFDESIPLDNDSRDNEEKSTAEEELDKLMEQLSPVERYALQFLESLQEPVGLEQLKLAEEEIEAQKKDWELGHLKALKQEEERLGDEDNPLFCSREASNQLLFSINGQEEMPIWAPPTPPTNENDIYMDHSVSFWYDPSFMHEARLPPIFIKKEAKRLKMDPIVSAVSTARKQKVRKDDMVNIPRSLFDRPSAAILKMRREVKLQKVKGLMVGPKPPHNPAPAFPTVKQPSLLITAGKPPPEQHHVADKPEWHVQEDWAILQVIQDLQNIPLNLTVLSPAHTPNWDLVSEAVYAVHHRYRSPRACKARYENVIVPREEGKILYDTNPKKQKKTKGIYKTKNNRPMKTSQLFVQDNNQAFMKVAREQYRLAQEQAAKRRAADRPPFVPTPKGTLKAAAILAESGINFDNPLTPMQIAQLRSERIAREKQKSQPVAAAATPLALAPVLSTVASPQVATATVVSQVPEQPPQQQQTTVTVATGTIHPHQAQAVLASLQAQQLQLSKGQPTVSLSKSLSGGIMVSSSTASTLASLTKALGQSSQATSTQNAAIAAALSNATIRNQRLGAATTTMSVQDIVAAGQARAASTAASGGISTTTAVVSVANLTAVQLATSQRLSGATLSPLTTVASAQLNPQAATTQRSIAHMAQMQQMKQNALIRQRETQLKQQLKRLHSVQQQGAAAGTAVAAKGGQPRVAQQVTMKQTAVGRPMTEAEVTQLMKRQQQKHQVNLTASQILAQVQPQQVAISSGATLVKTVSSPLAIPVSAVTMGGVNINVSVPQSKAGGVVGAKGATTITNQQLRQFQLQQQILNQARKGSKMTANLTQLAKVPGKGGVTAGTSVQIVPQQVKNLQTAMTVAQIQQAMKQAIPQNMPVVVTATPSLSGVQQQPVGAVKATTLPSTTLTTSGVLKGSTALTPQAVTLAVRAAQGQQQLQIQVQQSPHTLVSPQTQVVSTAALTQARMQLQPQQQQQLQTVTVQPQQLEQQPHPAPAAPTAAQLVQQTNAQMVQQAIQLARQQQAAAAAAQQAKASPYTMRLRNPPK